MCSVQGQKRGYLSRATVYYIPWYAARHYSYGMSPYICAYTNHSSCCAASTLLCKTKRCLRIIFLLMKDFRRKDTHDSKSSSMRIIGDEKTQNTGLLCWKKKQMQQRQHSCRTNKQQSCKQQHPPAAARSSSKHQEVKVRSILRSSILAVQATPPQRADRSLSFCVVLSAREGAVAAKIRSVAARVHALAAAAAVVAASSSSACNSACLKRLSCSQQRLLSAALPWSSAYLQQRLLAAALASAAALAYRRACLPQRLQQQHCSKQHTYLQQAAQYMQ